MGPERVVRMRMRRGKGANQGKSRTIRLTGEEGAVLRRQEKMFSLKKEK